MKITLVNGSDKSKKYIIHDSSPSLNLPDKKENKGLIVKNKFTGYTKQITAEQFIKNSPYSINCYNVFIKKIKKSSEITDLILRTKTHVLNEKFLNKIKDKNLITLSKDQYNFEIFKNISYSSLIENDFFEIKNKKNNIKIPLTFTFKTYLKKNINFNFFEKINDLIIKLLNKKIKVTNNYLTDLLNLEIPLIIKHDEFNIEKDVNLSGSILIPNNEIKFNLDEYKLNIPVIENLKKLDDFENIKINLSLDDVQNSINETKIKIDKLSSDILNFYDLNKIKRAFKLKFSCFNSYSNEPILLDQILINNEELTKTNFHYEINENKFEYFLSGETTNPYTLKFKKDGYDEKTLLLRPKYILNKTINDIDYLDLGSFSLINYGFYITYSLLWGNKPKDLDFHVFSFNHEFNKQLEHVNFKNDFSQLSQIYLHYDDTTSYGPEYVQIFNLNKEFYYLFSVHNYSYKTYDIFDDINMSPEGKTKVCISFNSKNKLSIGMKPNFNEKHYWWDAFIIHNDKIYVINEYSSDLRSKDEDWNFNENIYDINDLKEKMKKSKIYDFDLFKHPENYGPEDYQ